MKIQIFTILLFFLCSCDVDQKNGKEVDNDIAGKTTQDTLLEFAATFDTTCFNGKMVYDWREKEIGQPLANLTRGEDGIISPVKTQMVDIYSCTDEFSAYTLGIGRVIKAEEKELLPDSLVQLLASLGMHQTEDSSKSVFDRFVVIGLAEAYRISNAYQPDLQGTVFLACIKNNGEEFVKLERYETEKNENIYINIPLMSAHYLLFYKSLAGGYRIIEYGGAG